MWRRSAHRHRYPRQMPAVRVRAPQLQAMCLFRHLKPLRMHPANSGADCQKRRQEQLLLLRAAPDGGAGNVNGQACRCAQCLRKSLQKVENTWGPLARTDEWACDNRGGRKGSMSVRGMSIPDDAEPRTLTKPMIMSPFVLDRNV